MEIEYFIPPGDDEWPEFHKTWIDTCYNWLLSIGVKEDLIDFDVHEKVGPGLYFDCLSCQT